MPWRASLSMYGDVRLRLQGYWSDIAHPGAGFGPALCALLRGQDPCGPGYHRSGVPSSVAAPRFHAGALGGVAAGRAVDCHRQFTARLRHSGSGLIRLHLHPIDLQV